MWTEYCKMCIDPLIRFDADGNVVYEAAESYEVSEDGLVWTFHLRENGKWSDGSPVTAADFINTIQRALNPENGMSIYASVLYPIVGAQEARSGEGSLDDVAAVALDDYTLQFTLKAPCTYFTSLLTVGPFYPSKVGPRDQPGQRRLLPRRICRRRSLLPEEKSQLLERRRSEHRHRERLSDL